MREPRRSKRIYPYALFFAVAFFLGVGVTVLFDSTFLEEDTEDDEGGVCGESVGRMATTLPVCGQGERESLFPEDVAEERRVEEEKLEPGEGETIVRGVLSRDETIIAPIIRAGVAGYEADRAIRSLKGIFDFRRARPGDRYYILSNANGQMTYFSFKTSPIDIYIIRLQDGDYKGEKRPIETERRLAIMEGRIESSLWEALTKEGQNFELAVKLADVFAYDIDFYADLRKDDVFHVVYEQIYCKEDIIGVGNILAASYEGSFIGKKALYYYEAKKKYYDYNGTSATTAFLRSPLKFTRITSRFGQRLHPILRKWHFHGGVDYAAPEGTPVQAVGDGVVTFTGTQGAAGKMVTIKHRGGYESSYLHLSKISVKKGEKVFQKQVIGKVGNTGRSTGPHLDFRLKHRGKSLNPLKHVAPRTEPLKPDELKDFREKIGELKDMLERHAAEAKAALDETMKN